MVAMLITPTVWAGGFSITAQRIPSWDGTQLSAVVMAPQGQGAGPFPLVVMPTSWGAPNLEYVGRGAEMAGNGYIVVSFTSRGFWDSQGLIDIAGPDTVKDVSAVIDWALANTPVNPKAIGASGISYGAGISLLAAERDPRIKAVAAMSGWGDLVASLYANQTPSAQGLTLLTGLSTITGRPGPLLASASAAVLTGQYEKGVMIVVPAAPIRGAINDVVKLNANGTAVFLANSFNDSLFPPGQFVDLFKGISGPKHIMFSQGDHATAEVIGALGLPNEVYQAATHWLDHYLKGVPNGVDTESSVRLRSQDGVWHEYADWPAVQQGATTYSLTGIQGGLLPTGQLASSSGGPWSAGIATGIPTLASSGTAIVSGFLQGLDVPIQTSIPLILRGAAGVWMGPALPAARRLDGFSTLHVTVTPSQANTTLYAYLYSVDRNGVGQLLAHKPYSLRDVQSGVAQTIDVRLEANSWNIPAGNSIALAIGTVDTRYASATTIGGMVAFSSSAANPSTLTVPLH
ncbi:CocE/NonD family hydrolase [Burkholderia alba]|uniref:CocE/NonD family hydrolase n=1 Tax=Burkholderia alba TaxID=2683677 RepID=UPI002B05801D|nr:CocE/NonD family hydrolase [Burkholderia alba]